ncbi:MAG: hypothetical protein VYA36_04795, partial [Pseudomonadota bacterium]|nr:hypothetical protein [Pseudomonadota bacterium]
MTIDNDTTAINLGTVTARGNLSVRGGNGITDTGVITVSGTSLFHSDVTAKAITLDSVNAMAGAVSITHTGAADVAIDNGTTNLVLGTVGVGRNFEARSGGTITDDGVITVAGTSLFHSDVGGQVITLDSTNAMTGAVSITHTGAANVQIDNGTTALNLGTVSVGQNFTARSGGVISNSGVITVAGDATFVTDVNDIDIDLDNAANAITGALVFTTQTGGSNGADITLNNGSTAISLATFTTEGNLTLTTSNTAAFDVKAHTVNGDLAISTGGDITQTGNLTVTGASSFTSSGTDNDITLGETNVLTGAISATTAGTTGNVTIDNDTTAINLGTVTARGNLSVRGGNGITDTGVI